VQKPVSFPLGRCLVVFLGHQFFGLIIEIGGAVVNSRLSEGKKKKKWCFPTWKLEEPFFLFWFYWGAEVRSFLFSGLIEELSRSSRVFVVTRKIPEGSQGLAGKKVEFLELSNLPPSRLNGWVTSLANSAHTSWLQRRRETLAVGDRAAVRGRALGAKGVLKSGLGSALGYPVFLGFLNRLEMWLESRNRAWLSCGLGLDLGCCSLVSGDYLSEPGAAITAAVKNSGGVSFFCPLNWRDVYKGVRLRREFSNWWFWNQDMLSKAISFNPNLERVNKKVVGALQFDSHFREDWIQDRDAFLRKFGFDSSQPVVCYSAVADNAFSGEAGIVDSILEALGRIKEGGFIQFLIRLNPAGSDRAYRSLKEKYGRRIAVYDPHLEEPPASGPVWRAPSIEDAKVFANTIWHCAANIGLPSTVMLDFAVRGRDSICVGFDAWERSNDAGIHRFLEQPFFKEAVARGVWPVAETPDEAARLIVEIVGQPECIRLPMQEYVTDVVGLADGKNYKRVADMIRNRFSCTGGVG